MNIAVVDDDYTARTIIKDFLEDEDHNVIAAEYPEQLVNIENFDVIIIDVFIGNDRIAGINYIINQRAERRISNNTQIVFISNFGREASKIKEALQKVGEYDWLDKPIDFTRLYHILKKKSGLI